MLFTDIKKEGPVSFSESLFWEVLCMVDQSLFCWADPKVTLMLIYPLSTT